MSPQAARARKQVKEHPTLGCNVVVGTGAKVLGNMGGSRPYWCRFDRSAGCPQWLYRGGGARADYFSQRSRLSLATRQTPRYGSNGVAIAHGLDGSVRKPIVKSLGLLAISFLAIRRLRDSETPRLFLFILPAPFSPLPHFPLPTSHFPSHQ